jgi:hypothetical protein
VVKRDQQGDFERITRIITDDAIDSATITRLAGTGIPMTICGTASRRHVENMPVKRWRIGFANQDERLPFAAAVRSGMVAATAQAGVDLLLADNRSDGDVALANVESFIKAQVDLAVVFNTDARNNMIVEALRQVNVPVIAIDIPISATFFGFDNYRAGLMTGRLLGQYVRRQWHGVVDVVFSLGLPISWSGAGGAYARPKLMVCGSRLVCRIIVLSTSIAAIPVSIRVPPPVKRSKKSAVAIG